MNQEFEIPREELDNEVDSAAQQPLPDQQVLPEDIHNAQFSTRVRGYDREEVDAFLSALAAELEQLIENQQLLQNQPAPMVEDEEPYAKLGSDAGKLMQLARDHADRMKNDALAEIAAARAAAETEVAELLERAETEASALRDMAERDAKAIKDDADRLHTGALTRAREVEIETENMAAQAQTEVEGIRAAAETEARVLRTEAEEEAKRIKNKARADYTVVTREAHRDANRTEREARQRAEILKDEAEEKANERVRHARAEVRKLNDAESTLKKRIQALQSTLDSLSDAVEDSDAPQDTAPTTVDLTDTRSGPA
ncbi:MAG: DivIVA domain-containing protein [Actinobacteria bacterium]|nr:DivIVA domain-containing protein [Actinomycetota bacterium]